MWVDIEDRGMSRVVVPVRHPMGQGRSSASPLTILAALIGVAILLSAEGCASTRAKGPQVEAAIAGRSDALIQLRKQGCDEGVCPVYGVVIFENSDGLYVGGANVTVIGERKLRLAQGSLTTLLTDLEKIDFIDTPVHCCDCPTEPSNSRASLSIIDYRPGGIEKEVRIDERCSGLPDSLKSIEAEIAEMTQIEPLVVSRSTM